MDILNKDIDARYYYTKFGSNIELVGSANDSGYTLKSPYGTDAEIETFVLRIFHEELIGTWQKGNKTLNVNLYRNTNPAPFYQLNAALEAQTVDPKHPKLQDSDYKAEITFKFLWPDDAETMSTKIREMQFESINESQLVAENESSVHFKVAVDPRTVRGMPNQLIAQMNRYQDSFFAQYTRNVRNELKSEEPYITHISLSITNRIIYDSEKFQVIEEAYYEYSGGAHGIYGVSHKTWDKTQNKWVEASDLLNKKQLSKIPKAMNTQFKIARNIPAKEPLDQHGFWISQFEGLGGDTYFTDLGLYTSFGLYEIAPYSEGIIEVFVPWKDLK